METVKIAQAIQHVLNWATAYFIVLGPIGLFKAWIAQKMGDPTMAQEGMLTLNPVEHINPYNFFILLMLLGTPAFILFGLLLFYYSGVFGTHVFAANPWIINNTPKYLVAIFSPLFFNIVIAAICTLLSGFFKGIATVGFFSSFAPVLKNIFLCATFFILALTLLNFFNALVSFIMHIITREYQLTEQTRMILFGISIVVFIILLQAYGAAVEYAIRLLIAFVAGGIQHLVNKVI